MCAFKLAVRGCPHIMSANFGGFQTPPPPLVSNGQQLPYPPPPSSAMVSICLTPPPPLVSLRQHLADPPSITAFKENTLFDMK